MQHRQRFSDSAKAVYCFFVDFEIPIKIFQYGYQNFKNSHYDLYSAIKTDTKAETWRYKSFLKEILLNKKRIRNVSTHNLKYEATLLATTSTFNLGPVSANISTLGTTTPMYEIFATLVLHTDLTGAINLPSSAHIHVEMIPAPGACGVLGLAGLVAARRRRA